MKKIITIFIIAVLAAAMLAGCVPATPASSGSENKLIVQTEEKEDKNTLNVNANGEVEVMPDVAYVTLGFVNQARNAKKAQEANKEKMAEVMNALKGMGIEDKDLKTVEYSVHPQYDYSRSSPKITGYQVSNLVQVTINDIEIVGDVLDSAANAGANTNYAVIFDLKDRKAAYNDALKNALNTAMDKAKALSEAGGFKISGPIDVSEGGQGYYEYPKAVAAREEAAADMAVSTPISAGQLKITASVIVSYEIVKQ